MVTIIHILILGHTVDTIKNLITILIIPNTATTQNTVSISQAHIYTVIILIQNIQSIKTIIKTQATTAIDMENPKLIIMVINKVITTLRNTAITAIDINHAITDCLTSSGLDSLQPSSSSFQIR